MTRPLRILIVDDSPLFLEALRLILEEDSQLQVAGTATNGLEAVQAVRDLGPDLVAMDVQMPKMNGLEAVDLIMSSRPTPILLLTGDPERGSELWHFEALTRGALDLRVKPRLGPEGDADAREFREHIKLLASVPVVYRRRRTGASAAGLEQEDARHSKLPPQAAGASRKRGLRAAAPEVLGIVASTGGPPVLADVLGGLPASFPLPIFVVQHLAAGFAPQLVKWLDSACALNVSLAEAGMRVGPGQVVVAPAGRHLVLEGMGLAGFDTTTPPYDGHRPSGTVMLASLAHQCGAGAMGLVLTGMGRDGAEGLAKIAVRGGHTLAQDEASSAVYGMPKAAAAEGRAQEVLGRFQLADALTRLATRERHN